MGRYLAAGIPATIYLYGKKENFQKTRLESLQKKLGQYISLDLYNLEETDNGYYYSLKPDIFNKNIHQTLIEFCKVADFELHAYFFDHDYDIRKINSDNCEIKLVYDYSKDGDTQDGILVNDEFFKLDLVFQQYWLISNCGLDDYWSYDAGIIMKYIMIWFDFNKISSEDESNLLLALNKLKINSFKDCNDLTKSIMFYITG